MEKKRELENGCDVEKGALLKKSRLSEKSEPDETGSSAANIRVDFLTLSSVFHGKHVLPKILSFRTLNLDGQDEFKVFYLNPAEFIKPQSHFFIEELLKYGYDSNFTCIKVSECVIDGQNISFDRTEPILKTSDVVHQIVENIKQLKEKLGQNVILNLGNKHSKNFTLSLFRDTAELRQVLLDNVEEIAYDDSVSELLTDYLIDSCDDVCDENATLVFVDAVTVTYENEEMNRYSQFAFLGAFCETVNRQSRTHDSEIFPSILDAYDRPVKSLSRKKLDETLDPWRKNSPPSFLSEKEALSKFCTFLAECCSCSNDDNACDVTLVTKSGQELVPLMLSKVHEFDLEGEFFCHISNYAEIRKEMTPAELAKIRDSSIKPLSSACQMLKNSLSKEGVKSLKKISVNVAALKIDPSQLKSSRELLQSIFIGDSVECNVGQCSRHSQKVELRLSFGNKFDSNFEMDNDVWASKKKSASSHKVVLLKNVENLSLAEIVPLPNGNWSFMKYSVSNGVDVHNGTTNVFGGKLIVLQRRSGFDFPGQILGVCQFVRPSLGRTLCPSECSKTVNVSSVRDFSLTPGSLTVAEAKIVDTDASVRSCIDADHVYMAECVLIPGLAVLDGLVAISGGCLKFVVKNVSGDVVNVTCADKFMSMACTFNKKGIHHLLSRESKNILLRWWSPKSCGTDPSEMSEEVIYVESSEEELDHNGSEVEFIGQGQTL